MSRRPSEARVAQPRKEADASTKKGGVDRGNPSLCAGGGFISFNRSLAKNLTFSSQASLSASWSPSGRSSWSGRSGFSSSGGSAGEGFGGGGGGSW